ncbi:pentapeptide repeat-containing protein [Pontibacter sp. BT310]|uniref:Pentapeptide repeat-containing protein n=2 Tax=Pontibacter TaxID=323449 RepID=A0ABS6XC26_9BACT|nr:MULTISPECIES: pentapeptide repeat-containing protein [Pontibacter]MBJ6118689.1 pentapeptide repeat-containing protein [Pontibacter sp. BT310]MBR0571118.1 pentapeptide repeat-containing protein [Microvirga sp. STS03]MBW3365543.1 pentapeptide repeat-containing protein [Pontibacter populi]
MEGQIHTDKTFEKVVYPNKDVKNREFENCTFKNCDFSGSNFAGTRFTDCTFIGCNLAMLKLGHATISNVVFKECKLTGINFSECEDFLFTVYFENCLLDYASFAKRKMAKTKFIKCSLKGVDFSNANLTSALFDNTDMERAVFNYTNLTGADLSSAYSFDIDPEINTIKKAKFSQYGLQGLLMKYSLQIV